MVEYWNIIKPILGFLFILGALTLPFLLIVLSIEKKKLSMYSRDIIKNGHITKKYQLLSNSFDVLLLTNIFNSNPDYKRFPSLKESKELEVIQKRVNRLVNITKPTFVIFLLLVVSLIILLNMFEG